MPSNSRRMALSLRRTEFRRVCSLGMMHVLISEKLLDADYIARHTLGYEPLRERVLERYTPEWAAAVADVPETAIRRLAIDYLAYARVGETIEVEGVVYPHRPVAIVLGSRYLRDEGLHRIPERRARQRARLRGIPGPIAGR